MTAHAMEGDRQRMLAEGMDDYVSKPVRIEELTRALHEAVYRQHSSSSTDFAVQHPVSEQMTKSPGTSIDMSVYNHFATVMNASGEGVLNELITIYISDGKNLLLEMRQSYDRDDPDGCRRVAHSFKSSSAQLGALHLASLCRELEEFAQDASCAHLSPRMVLIAKEFERVCSELLLLSRGSE